MYYCAVCNKIISFPSREYARVVDELYCSEQCFLKCFIIIDINKKNEEETWLYNFH